MWGKGKVEDAGLLSLGHGIFNKIPNKQQAKGTVVLPIDRECKTQMETM